LPLTDFFLPFFEHFARILARRGTNTLGDKEFPQEETVMRLTLRTMLAYLDNVLDPADAEDLGRKINESDFASGLVQRTKGVLKKLRMDAPKLDGKGIGNDANTVSEYLALSASVWNRTSTCAKSRRAIRFWR
jgi:hypothetical protein